MSHFCIHFSLRDTELGPIDCLDVEVLIVACNWQTVLFTHSSFIISGGGGVVISSELLQ